MIRRLALIALLTVVGAAAGATYAAVKTPTYLATAYVVAIASEGDPATALNFAQAYGRIATSGPVLATARSRLSDASGLSSVRSSTSPDAPVVEIVATGTDARHTSDLANAVAHALADYASKRSKDTNVKLSVLAPATVPARPTSPKPPLELAIGAAAGLLIGGLAALGGGGRGEPPPKPARDRRTSHTARASVPPAPPGRTVATPVFAVPPARDLDGAQPTMLLHPASEQPVSPAVGIVPSTRVVGRVPVNESEDER